MNAVVPRLQVVIDVSEWPEADRRRLLTCVHSIEGAVAATGAATSSDGGWTLPLVVEALQLTGYRAADQLRCVLWAVEHGEEELTREKVYELTGYNEKRTLRGFTRPFNRATQQLKDAGQLPPSAPDLLEPVYDPAVAGRQRVMAFRVPHELVVDRRGS